MFKFYNIELEDTICHRLPNWSLDNTYSYRSWYHEDIAGKDRLLITIGDSWTWGDHLGIIDWDNYTDDPIRLTQIFGRHLSNMLDADWVNIAEPGCSNYWMIERLVDITPAIKESKYKSIDIVITLTEDLREAEFSRRYDVTTPYTQFFNQSESLREFLIKVEQMLLEKLKKCISELPGINFYISRAFTDFLTTDNIIIPKTWCDVIQDDISRSDYIKPVSFITEMAIKPLTKKYIDRAELDKQIKFKSEFLEIMETVTNRWNFLGNRIHNLRGSTSHPTPSGHELWANYLHKYIVRS